MSGNGAQMSYTGPTYEEIHPVEGISCCLLVAIHVPDTCIELPQINILLLYYYGTYCDVLMV